MKCEVFDNIITLEEVDSTNTYLKKYSKNLPVGSVVFADEQTAGKGRLSRKWAGEKGKSIACSFLIKDVYDNTDAVRLSFLFSIAVKSVLTKYISYDKIALKWPNDVLSSGKKICGILSEYSKNCVIIGIGINVLDFIPKCRIDQPWTTIELESGIRADIKSVRQELVLSVNSVFSRYCTNDLNDIPFIWFREAEIMNIPVTVKSNDISHSGIIKSIDDKGILYFQEKKSRELKSISFGDITYND